MKRRHPMRKVLFPVVLVAALTFVGAAPTQAKASWLSQALHAYLDPYYAPNYYYGYSPTPYYSDYYAPYSAYVPPSGYYGGYGYSHYPYTYSYPTYSYPTYPYPYTYGYSYYPYWGGTGRHVWGGHDWRGHEWREREWREHRHWR
jgi:hypothetical protein